MLAHDLMRHGFEVRLHLMGVAVKEDGASFDLSKDEAEPWMEWAVLGRLPAATALFCVLCPCTLFRLRHDCFLMLIYFSDCGNYQIT